MSTTSFVSKVDGGIKGGRGLCYSSSYEPTNDRSPVSQSPVTQKTRILETKLVSNLRMEDVRRETSRNLDIYWDIPDSEYQP